MRDGLISEEALFRALLRQESTPKRLGEILVEDGLLTSEQLVQALRATTEAQLYDLFLWPDGRFDFDDRQPPPERRRTWRSTCAAARRGPSPARAVGAAAAALHLERADLKPLADPVTVADPALRQIVDLAAWGKTLAAISLETRRSEFETTLLVGELCDRGVLAIDRMERDAPESDPVGTILALLAVAATRLDEGRFDAALEGYEQVLAIDPLNQAAKKGLLAVADARRRAKTASKVPLDKVPALRLTAMALAQQRFTPEEGFVLSRINGQWDIRSILKLCPMPDEQALLIFARLLERQVIELR